MVELALMRINCRHYAWRRAFWRMSLRVNFSGEVKGVTPGAGAKASLNRARVAGIRHETKWATHDQGEAGLTTRGGPNFSILQNCEMSCG